VIRRFLIWTTLIYSPSLMAIDPAHATAWFARRERAKQLPIIGAFFRAWERA
jgi:hypothetical protein